MAIQVPQSKANLQSHTHSDLQFGEIPICSGDLLVAMCSMRSWESPERKGSEDFYINYLQLALVVATWKDMGHTRLIVIVNERLRIFSCRTANLSRNWEHAQDYNERVKENRAWLPKW